VNASGSLVDIRAALRRPQQGRSIH
jgi:hypothetical protein